MIEPRRRLERYVLDWFSKFKGDRHASPSLNNSNSRLRPAADYFAVLILSNQDQID